MDKAHHWCLQVHFSGGCEAGEAGYTAMANLMFLALAVAHLPAAERILTHGLPTTQPLHSSRVSSHLQTLSPVGGDNQASWLAEATTTPMKCQEQG
jgi:hypothetical protein